MSLKDTSEIIGTPQPPVLGARDAIHVATLGAVVSTRACMARWEATLESLKKL